MDFPIPTVTRFKHTTAIGLLLAVSLTAHLLPVCGQPGDSVDAEPEPPEFNLNATVTDGLELTRSSLNKQSHNNSNNPFKPAEQAVPMPDVTVPTAVAAAMPALRNTPNMLRQFIPGLKDSGDAREAVVPLQSGAGMHEYGVDWSAWMSAVADRWYFQLQRLEEQSPYEFYTDGPAQIEFTCYANGQVSNIVIRRSCGVPAYDRMQVDALLAAAPMPPFPGGTQRTSYTLCQGWEAHARRPGESDYRPGTFGKDTPEERVQQWD